MAHLFRVTRRVGHRRGAAARQGKKRKALQPRRFHDRLQIGEAALKGKIVHLPGRQPAAAHVVAYQGMAPRKAGKPVIPDRALPLILEVTEPVGDLDQRRPAAHRGVGDLRAIRHLAETDLLPERGRGRFGRRLGGPVHGFQAARPAARLDGVQRRGHLAHAARPAFRLFGQHLLDQRDQCQGQVGAKSDQRRRRFREDQHQHLGQGVADEGAPPGEHLVKQHAQAPDVAALVQPVAAQGLRAHIGRTADEGAGPGQADVFPHQTHRAKVGQPGRAIGGEQDVGRLEVAMDDAQMVGARQGIGQLQPQAEDALHGQRRFGLQPV